MKSGVAVHAAAGAPLLGRAGPVDLTYVFYDCEEIEAERNGLGRLVRDPAGRASRPTSRSLLEPTNGVVEAGCQGTMRARITLAAPGRTARGPGSATTRSTRRGAAAARRATEPRPVEIEGWRSAEGLTRSAINGGVAGNVIPDACSVLVNFRFAPDRD